MHKFRRLILLILYLIFVFGCESDIPENMDGNLIYSAGSNYISIFNLNSLTEKIIYQSQSNAAIINSISKVSPQNLIFSECTQNECIIKEFNISTTKISSIGKGRYLKYLEEFNKTIFYKYSDIDQSEWVWVANKLELDKAKKLIKAPNAKEMIGERMALPLMINSGNVLLMGKDSQLLLYEISSEKISRLGWGNCFPKAWRSKTKKVICQDLQDLSHYQVDLENNIKENLSMLKRFGYGLIYIPFQDSIIGVDVEFKIWPLSLESFYTYMYDFKDSRKFKIKEGFVDSGYWLN